MDMAMMHFRTYDVENTGFLTKEQAISATQSLIERTAFPGYYNVRTALRAVEEMTPHPTHVSRAHFALWWFDHLDVHQKFYDPHLQRAASPMRRLGAVCIDMMLYGAIPLFFLNLEIMNLFVKDLAESQSFLGYYGISEDWSNFFCWIPYSLKDVFTSRSYGKKVMGLEIVQIERVEHPNGGEEFRTTDIPATKSINMFRALLSFAVACEPNDVNFVEGFDSVFFFFTPTRRCLESYISGTMIVPEGPMYDARVEKMQNDAKLSNSPMANIASVAHPAVDSEEEKATRRLRPRKWPSLLTILAGFIVYLSLDGMEIDVEVLLGLDDDDDDSSKGTEA